MRKILYIFILIASSTAVYAQTNNVDSNIDILMIIEDYNTIITDYGDKNVDDYSAKSLYNIGFSYYMLEKDNECLKYMDLAIKKDSAFSAPYFIKGSTLNYMNKLEEAIPLFLKAISLESDKLKLAHSYVNLGYSYYQLNKYELALEAYNKAIEYDNSAPIPYMMIAQIYSDRDQKEKSLDAYYKGKENVSKEYNEYITILFNIGLLEQLRNNYKNAETIYNELLEIDPNDYHTYAKLIQIYNHNKEYEKVFPLKKKLYSAHKEGLIKDENLLDMFCIDQFMHNNRQIKVFERYEDGDSKKIYNKLLFYILDENQNIDFRIQAEYSPAAVAFGEAKYMLCANKGEIHINYGIGFDDNSTYDEIKNTVISILERKN